MSKRKPKRINGNFCSDCKLPIEATVPGTSLCLVSHVDPDGNPCMDGKSSCAPGDSCSEWAVKFMADCEKVSVAEWQQRNLEGLYL